jgi:hypothetical protein
MQECVEVLDREKDQPGDELLVTLVRLQLIADEGHKLWAQDFNPGQSSKTPSYIFRKGMIQQVQDIRQGLTVKCAASRTHAPFVASLD